MFLENKKNTSKEEGNIISSALSLWSAAIVQKHDLVEDFFSWVKDAGDADDVGGEERILTSQDFLLHGIYSPKSLFVRNQFKECIELICEKVTKNLGERPLFFVIKVLMDHFPSPTSPVGTRNCSEYFNLFGALIGQYQELLEADPEEVAEASNISVADLLTESFARLKAHESTERDGDSKVEDSTLCGLTVLVKELLVCYSK